MTRSCRFCSAPLECVFCDLGMSPLSNSYRSVDDLATYEINYPLKAYVCGDCYLVQLQEFESPHNIFSDYAYLSSYSETWLHHAKKYAALMQKRLGLGSTDQVVEIASNDGYLLQYFQQLGVRVYGVEPAENVAKIALEKAIPTRNEFFGSKCAEDMITDGLKADLLIGNNVLAHVTDLNDFVVGLRTVLKPGGTITLEFPHLLRLINGNQFDTIYHEHFSYFSVMTAERVFASHQLRIFDVDELSTHGGSVRIYVCHADDARKSEESLTLIRGKEEASGLNDITAYTGFIENARVIKNDLLDFLIQAKRERKNVAAYGAPAKGNTLLNYCGIGRDFIDFTVDRNPEKQGRYLPGSQIPVFSPEKLLEQPPDYVVILPWNIKDEILGNNHGLRQFQTKFVVPIPHLEVM